MDNPYGWLANKAIGGAQQTFEGIRRMDDQRRRDQEGTLIEDDKRGKMPVYPYSAPPPQLPVGRDLPSINALFSQANDGNGIQAPGFASGLQYQRGLGSSQLINPASTLYGRVPDESQTLKMLMTLLMGGR